MQTDIPFWLQGLTIIGRDGDEDPNDQDQDNSDDVDDDDEDGENPDDSSSKDGPDDDSNNNELEGLKEALRKERRLRRQAEREARKAAKKKDNDKEQQDLAQTQEALKAAETRSQRLAQGLLRREVDNAILEEARSLGFIDPTDALTDDIRKAVDSDQDDEDPTDIDIDRDSVRDAVKALANKKKHLVGKAMPTERSGGKFRKKSEDDRASDSALTEHYPSLR